MSDVLFIQTHDHLYISVIVLTNSTIHTFLILLYDWHLTVKMFLIFLLFSAIIDITTLI